MSKNPLQAATGGLSALLLNLRIRTRLMMAFCGVFVLMVALAGYAGMRMAHMHGQMKHITESNNREVAEVNKMIYLVTQQSVSLRNLALLKDADQKKAELEAINKYRADYETTHANLLKLIQQSKTTEAETALLEAIERTGNSTKPLIEQAIQLAQGEDQSAAITFLMDRVRPRQARWVVVLQTLSGLQDKTSAEFVQDANADFQRAGAWMVGMVLAAVVGGVIVAWAVTKSITRPLDQAVKAANTVAQGDLSMRIVSRRKDELGDLLRSLDAMASSLAAVVSEVRQGSESIAHGTGEIASGNMDLSHRTERQAANLQRTAQSMADIRLTARGNADAASQAQQVAGEASRAAAVGGEVVSQVVQTMDGIAGASKRVVDIIGVIDSLAFQTNILALNAAVEAARAGEQGRGFAVVASEVRALAQRSAESSREIRSLIHASVEQVESGARLVQGAGSSMNEIVTQVSRVNALIQDISHSASDETAGIDSIGDAVADIDTLTQQNAALVEESAAAAESLRQQAQRLLDAVGRFKLQAA